MKPRRMVRPEPSWDGRTLWLAAGQVVTIREVDEAPAEQPLPAAGGECLMERGWSSTRKTSQAFSLLTCHAMQQCARGFQGEVFGFVQMVFLRVWEMAARSGLLVGASADDVPAVLASQARAEHEAPRIILPGSARYH